MTVTRTNTGYTLESHSNNILCLEHICESFASLLPTGIPFTNIEFAEIIKACTTPSLKTLFIYDYLYNLEG